MRMSSDSKAPSMVAVAIQAGVSKATVSRVLNGKSGVSDDIRDRVVRACEDMNYRLNTSIQDLARATLSGSTNNIAFVLVGREFGDPYYARMMDGIAKGVAQSNYHLIFAELSGEEKSTFDLPPILRDNRVDGILVSGNLNSDVVATLSGLETPYVILGNYKNSVIRNAFAVETDTGMGIHNLVHELRLAGKNKVAYVAETLELFSEQQHFRLFQEALKDNCMVFHDDIVYIGKGSRTGMFHLLKDVFRGESLPFDSIYCSDYRVADEVSHLTLARYGLDKAIDIIIATERPYSYYTLPVPAIYVDASLEELAYNGMNLMLDKLLGNEYVRPTKLLLSPSIDVAL